MNNSPYQLRVIILWLLLLIGTILHFNYYVGKIFYGINVARPGANGIVPLTTQLLKSVYYHLPMIFIVALLYLRQRWFKISMFVISLLYTISNAFHVWEEVQKPEQDWGQIPLLSLVFIFSLMLNKASWDYYKYERNVQA